jgi:plasmid stabilization system protein ParE
MSAGKFAVHWAKSAELDLINIISYIADDNQDAALETLKKIKNACRSLNSFPKRCRIVPELKQFGITVYRETIVSHYRVQFRIDDDRVLVLGLLDSRRNLGDILLDRFSES